jgi:hypothetical protein
MVYVKWSGPVRKIRRIIYRRRKGISYIKLRESRLTGFVTSCVGTAFLNILLEEIMKECRNESKTRKNT